MVYEIGYQYELFGTKEDIFLIYEKQRGDDFEVSPHYHLKINVFNAKTFNMQKTIDVPFYFIIENIFYSNKYKNIVFIFLFSPLLMLNLIIFDFELNQINTIINLIKPYYQENIFKFRPRIKEVNVLKNNRLYIKGMQTIIKINDPDNDKHEFIIIYNLDNFEIEFATKYYKSDKDHFLSEEECIDK